jgi:hypothetical protein
MRRLANERYAPEARGVTFGAWFRAGDTAGIPARRASEGNPIPRWRFGLFYTIRAAVNCYAGRNEMEPRHSPRVGLKRMCQGRKLTNLRSRRRIRLS